MKLSAKKSERKEKRILWISFTAGLLFAVVEFLFALINRSQSVLMDAVYDTTESIFLALILYLTPLFYKPVSEKHPYGFFQLETILLIIKGFMMVSVSFGVSAEILQSAMTGGNTVNEAEVSVFQLILGLVSIGIYWILSRMNHSLNSPTVQAEIMEWRLDISYSLGLSAAFYASTFLKGTRLEFLSPYFDPVVAVIVMMLMLPDNIRLLWGAIKDIFLLPPDDDTVADIKEICNTLMEQERIDPVYVDVNRTGRHMWVAVYFDTAKDNLSVARLREITNQVNRQVGEKYGSCTCELIMKPE